MKYKQHLLLFIEKMDGFYVPIALVVLVHKYLMNFIGEL